MIAFLSGTIKDSIPGEVIVLTSGVGFAVSVPTSTNFTLGDSVELFIHTHLRDDDISLYGLTNFADLKLFEKLISVSGIGPKMALNIFSSSTNSDIVTAISESNLTFFTSISGIGKKTAQKLILDLKSKVSSGDVDLRLLEGHSDLVDALIALGYQKKEINSILTQVNFSESLQSQIKQSLKLLA